MNIIDLKEKDIFKKEERGFANLVEEEYLQINQVCLEPGQQVPQHNANSNVTLTVIHGEPAFQVGNEVTRMGPWKLLRVPFQSPHEYQERIEGEAGFFGD